MGRRNGATVRTTTRLKCLVTVLGLGFDLKKKPLEINPDIYKHVLKLDFPLITNPNYTQEERRPESYRKKYTVLTLG